MPAALLGSFEMPSRCAPPCRTRTASSRLPVVGKPAVGRLELLRELALVALLALRHRRARAPVTACGVTGDQLQPPQLVAGERRAPEGVVLFVGEQVPKQHAELARRGDERDLRAAPGAQPLIEGAQRVRRADDDPRGLADKPMRETTGRS
jgi:hypothetical protein